MPILAMDLVNLLKTNTRRTLETYPLTITGYDKPSGIERYYIQDADGGGFRGGTVLGNLNVHATQKFRIRTAAGFPENAHHIRMVASDAPIVLHPLPNNGEPILMFTGGLSGCSFIVNAQANSIACAHLEPKGETGEALHNRLKRMPYTAVYGRNDYSEISRQVAIVGVLRNNQWKVYAQKNQFDFRTGDLTIRKVKRIYPI
jgi:hypothetical protein